MHPQAFFKVGVGLTRFNRHINGGATSASPTAAFDIGGGLDIKLAPFISLRRELRDFNSGGLGLQTPVAGRQNNLFCDGWTGFRF
jgi:hypothetical protein